MEWFRFYAEVLDDPKVQRLDPWLFKQWVNILCLAGKAEPRGSLPNMDDIAFALRLSGEEATRAISELRERDLLDDRDGMLVPHNWQVRQKSSDDVTARVRKHRSGPSGNVTLRAPKDETLHETETERFGNGLDKRRVDTEQSREEFTPSVSPPSESESASPPQTDEESTPVEETIRPVPKPRPTRLPKDFELTDPYWDFAKANGLPAELVLFETEKFKDHYHGSTTTKTDWLATWRNWMRRVPDFAQRQHNGRASPPRGQPFSAMAELANLENAERRAAS